jgi:phage anti-repressor protein
MDQEELSMNELVSLKQNFEVIAQSTEQFPVDFDQAWQWVEYSTKQKAREALERNFEERQDFLTLRLKSTGGRPGDGYFLTVDCFKSFCMMAGTDKGKEVRRYYLEIEKKLNKLRQGLMEGTIIPPQAMAPQIEGGLNKAVISHDENYMDALWLYSVGVIGRKDLIRFRFGAAVEPSEAEFEIDPLCLWWAMQISALRQIKALPDSNFPLTGAKLEAILRGRSKSASGTLIRHCAYGTAYEENKSYSREVAMFLADRYFETYEKRFEEQEFTRFPPVKAVYDQLKSNYQYAGRTEAAPVYLWPQKSPKEIAEMRFLFEAGAYTAKRIRVELFGNQASGDQKALPSPKRGEEGAKKLAGHKL